MPRTPRMVIGDETAVYHVMSRTALDGFPLGDIDAKGNLVGMTIEHAKANADLWEFSFQEMPQQTA